MFTWVRKLGRRGQSTLYTAQLEYQTVAIKIDYKKNIQTQRRDRGPADYKPTTIPISFCLRDMSNKRPVRGLDFSPQLPPPPPSLLLDDDGGYALPFSSLSYSSSSSL